MRRLFIVRKDLKLKPGKLAAMVGHLCEAYWTNAMKAGHVVDNEFKTLPTAVTYPDGGVGPAVYKNTEIFDMSRKAFDEGKTSFTYRPEDGRPTVTVALEIPKDVWNDYVNGIFTKTICEARSIGKLNQAAETARGLNLSEGLDWGYIKDKCLTDLEPENEDGTTTIGIWFKPLPDDIARSISRKFPLYRD